MTKRGRKQPLAASDSHSDWYTCSKCVDYASGGSVGVSSAHKVVNVMRQDAP